MHVLGPFGSPSGLLDQKLGDAYTYVKIVADAIETIKSVATNITAVKDAARNMALKHLTIEGPTAAIGNISYIALPEGIGENLVVSSQVVIVGTDSAIYAESTGEFSHRVAAGFLEIDVPGDALAVLGAATARWTITYQD